MITVAHRAFENMITDGRFSGATRGAAIGHVSPEAASGGAIAIIQDGDIIELKKKTRYLARYAANVSSADKGAVFQL